jgi:uncharacterized protein (TIGR03437 family)
MKGMRLALFLAVPCSLGAQLLLPGSPIPKGAHPPVVFLNGYQGTCGDSSFSSTFGKADQVLQAAQLTSLFFDNCTVAGATSGKPTIEALGAAFGAFLRGLRYTDGSAVNEVDVVAHSMGGLILRTYLAGKTDATPAAYTPPENTGVRKAIFLATPHFGTALAGQLGTDVQTRQMALGSQFLFDLNTWNEGLDDLRGVDALAIAGTGGTGLESGTVLLGGGLDDGVVALNSASLGFVRAGRTRLVPACHASISLLVIFGFCTSSAQPIAAIMDSSSVTGQIVLSFLTGTTTWQSLGQAIEENGLASASGGINLQLQDATGTPLSSRGGIITSPTGLDAPLGQSSTRQVLYLEIFPAGSPRPIQIQTDAGPVQTTQTLPSGTVATVIVKPGPVIRGAVPAAGPVFPYNVAPGAFVAIYGTDLAGGTMAATAPNYPTTLGDVQVKVNGAANAIQYISPGQLNVIWPDGAPGLAKLTVVTAGGSFTTNVIVQAAVPSVFTLGGNAAAAINGVTGVVVSPSTPLRAGVDTVTLFLTGLGPTIRRNNLDYAQIQPAVTIGGQACNIGYAGRVPGYPALDQISCSVPAGLYGAAVPVIVTSNGRAAHTVTLNIQ